MIDELLREYAEQFGEAFPVYSFPGDETELELKITECLNKDVPYEPEYDDDVDY